MNISDVKITDIQPSQFYICKHKIANIKKWFQVEDLSNFEPVPVKLLQGQLVFTDGHTRAVVAHAAGLSHIPLVWDTDELDLELYQLCVSACKRRGVHDIVDLQKRRLSQNAYNLKWKGWCKILQEVLELQREKG